MKLELEGAAPAHSNLPKLDDAQALYEQGCVHYKDDLDANSGEKAFKYFQEAAKLGHSDAQNDLGMLYLNGYGVDYEPVKAAYWFKKSARQDNVQAMLNYVSLLLEGEGVTKDKEHAKMWLEKAKDLGSQQATEFLETHFAPSSGKKNFFILLVVIGLLPWAIFCASIIMPLLASIGVQSVRIGLLVAIIILPAVGLIGVINAWFDE